MDPIEQLRRVGQLNLAGRHAEALSILTTLAGQGAGPAVMVRVHLRRGDAHRGLLQGQEAVDAYLAAAELSARVGDVGNAVLAWLGVGTSHRVLTGRLLDAEIAFDRSLHLVGPDGPFRSTLLALGGELRLERWSLVEALAFLHEAMAIAPTDGLRKNLAGQAARAAVLLGELNEAERLLSDADDGPFAQWARAALELERGAIASAQARFEAMDGPDLDDTWKGRALLGRVEAALVARAIGAAGPLVEVLQRLAPQEAVLVTARHRIAEGKVDEALAILLPQTAPADQALWLSAERVVALAAAGRFDEAARELGHAQTLLGHRPLPGPRARLRVRAGLLAATQNRWEEANEDARWVEWYVREQRIGPEADLARLLHFLQEKIRVYSSLTVGSDAWWLAQGVPESLLGLRELPQLSEGTVTRPEPRWVTELAQEGLGQALCATSTFQDEFVIRAPDGTYLRYHLEDGEICRYPGLLEAVAALIVFVWEMGDQREAGRAQTLRFAQATGIRSPEALVNTLAAMYAARRAPAETWNPVELHPFLR